ncbi:MAG: pyridoxal-phosphate dependent enzyme [Ilumatobacter sp.]|nr:pyridoxal-phosphate dependent enzyme [Ilumatobacter sp.]
MDRPGRAGSEAGAATRHYGSDSGDPATGPSTALVGVEPISANCVQASIEANELVHVPGPHPSIMVGLNCGMGSAVAWPHIVANVEWFVGVGDDDAGAAMRDLAAAGIVAGETGRRVSPGCRHCSPTTRRANGSDTTVVLLVTEGATGPVNHRARRRARARRRRDDRAPGHRRVTAARTPGVTPG